MPRFRLAARAALVGLAVIAAVAPRPADVVERVYSVGLYPSVQAALTSGSNVVPIAVFDLVVLSAAGWILWRWGRAVMAWRRRDWQPTWTALLTTATLAAALYLWFVAAWGLNYARPPLETRLALPARAVTAGDVDALLDEAVSTVNGRYLDAHAAVADDDRAVADALGRVEARAGRPRPIVPGVAKPSVLAPYFRMAGVDGLTAPFALETLLNPDLTPMERPFVLAHEWAHLAGHADEADANFVAWRALAGAPSPQLQYSAWLFLVSETAGQASPPRRRAALARLDEGPRADLAAIAARARDRVEVVQRVGWGVYDRYLRAQGVGDGVRSYSRVVQLVVRARHADLMERSRP